MDEALTLERQRVEAELLTRAKNIDAIARLETIPSQRRRARSAAARHGRAAWHTLACMMLLKANASVNACSVAFCVVLLGAASAMAQSGATAPVGAPHEDLPAPPPPAASTNPSSDVGAPAVAPAAPLEPVAARESAPPPPPPPPPPQAVEAPEPAPEPIEHASSRAGVGLVAGAGLHTGLALGARVGVGDIGFEATGGYQLLVALWEDEGGDGNIDAASSAQLGTELYATPWHPIASSAIGLKSGYRYNNVLHHGFAIAITFLVDLNEHLALEGLAGAQIFPGAAGRLRSKLGIPETGDLVYASNAQFFEYGFELIWYP